MVEWWGMLLVTSFLGKCPDSSSFSVPCSSLSAFLEGNTVAAVFSFIIRSHLQVLLPGVVLNAPLSLSWTVWFCFYLRYSLHPSLTEEQPRVNVRRKVPWNEALSKWFTLEYVTLSAENLQKKYVFIPLISVVRSFPLYFSDIYNEKSQCQQLMRGYCYLDRPPADLLQIWYPELQKGYLTCQ